MRWAEIKIETTPEGAEAISELLMQQGCRGTAMTGADPVLVTGHLPVDDQLEPRLLALKDSLRSLAETGFPVGDGSVSVSFVEEQDWANAWKQFYKPMRIGKHIIIKPSWESINAQPDDIVIELDPGMAFGSGTHASTQLCIEALEKYLKPGDKVLDIGTGSGILAVAAARLGASHVLATDDDPVAVEVAADNVRINGMTDRIDARQADLLASIPDRADLILSNIIADVVIRLSPDIPAHLNQDGVWISAGIINTRLEDVKAAIAAIGMRVVEVLPREEWVAVIATR